MLFRSSGEGEVRESLESWDDCDRVPETVDVVAESDESPHAFNITTIIKSDEHVPEDIGTVSPGICVILAGSL